MKQSETLYNTLIETIPLLPLKDLTLRHAGISGDVKTSL